MALRVVGIDARVDRDDRGRDRRESSGGEDLDVVAVPQPGGDLCATVKSTCTASSTPCSVVSWVPSFRYWPGCTSEMPTRARNGARIVLRAMIAFGARDLRERDVALGARPVDFHLGSGAVLARALHAVEHRLGERGLRFLGLQLGLLDRRRRARRAPCPARRSGPASRSTSRTVPASSFRSVIERSASTVPIDVVSARCSRSFATATVTDSIGSGWLASAASAPSNGRSTFHAARPRRATARPRAGATDPIRPRRFMGGASPRLARNALRLAR